MMQSNIRRVFNGVSRDKNRKVKDMVPGEIGYVVSWAITDMYVEPEAIISNHLAGTTTVKIICVSKGLYDVDFKP